MDAGSRAGRRCLVARGSAEASTRIASIAVSNVVSTGSSAACFALLNFEELALNVDLDLVAHDELAVQHHVEPHTEVLPVDLALGRVAYPVTHVRIVEFTVLDDGERHRPHGALYGQVARQLVAIGSSGLDLGALEADGRVLLDL